MNPVPHTNVQAEIPPASNTELVGELRKSAVLIWGYVDRTDDTFALPNRVLELLKSAEQTIAELRGRALDASASVSDAVADGQLNHVMAVLDGREDS